MHVGKLAWPSLNANWARIYGKISRITLWTFDLRLGKFSASTSLTRLEYKISVIDFKIIPQFYTKIFQFDMACLKPQNKLLSHLILISFHFMIWMTGCERKPHKTLSYHIERKKIQYYSILGYTFIRYRFLNPSNSNKWSL